MFSHLQSYDSNVDESRKYPAQGLARHHPPHVLGGELPGHPHQAALEDGGADVEEDHDEKGGGKEPALPEVRVYPGHDEDRNEQGRHHCEGAHDSHVQPELLSVNDVEDDKDGVGNVGGDCQV